MDGLVNTIATCISALAACISSYLAARAIRDSRETRRAELDAARPYFNFSNFGLKRPTIAKALSSDKQLLDPRVAHVEGLLANDGHRSAMNVTGVILVLPAAPKGKAGAYPIGIADDVSPKSEWQISTAPLEIIPSDFPGSDEAPHYYDPGFFVLTCISYTDPLSERRYVQNSLMRWPGISNGVVAGNFYATERKDKDALLSVYSDFLRPRIESGLLIVHEVPLRSRFAARLNSGVKRQRGIR